MILFLRLTFGSGWLGLTGLRIVGHNTVSISWFGAQLCIRNSLLHGWHRLCFWLGAGEHWLLAKVDSSFLLNLFQTFYLMVTVLERCLIFIIIATTITTRILLAFCIFLLTRLSFLRFSFEVIFCLLVGVLHEDRLCQRNGLTKKEKNCAAYLV